MPRRPLRVFVALLAGALALTGCTAGSSPKPAPTPTTPSTPRAVPVPNETPADRAANWILTLLRQDADVTAPQLQDRFADVFTKQVPLTEVATLLNKQIRPAAPFVVTAYQSTASQARLSLSPTVGEPFVVEIAVDDANKISGFFLKPAEPAWKPSASLDEVRRRLEALPVTTSFDVVQTKKGADTDTVLEKTPTQTGPLGSTFKLYVLLALADAVSAGEVRWDDTLTVTAALKSLPSGKLQDAPEGTKVTVRDAATAMISISDNTATDLLVNRLGQQRLAAAVRAGGHHDPAALAPFAPTRAFFQLGWGKNAKQLRAQWKTADSAARQRMLDALAKQPLEVNPVAVTTPTWQDGVDWFASPADIVAVHESLATAKDPEVRKILAVNSGLGDLIDANQWPYVAFKGGSAPGVLVGSWRAQRADGSSVTIVLQLSSDDPQAIAGAQSSFVNLSADILRLLG